MKLHRNDKFIRWGLTAFLVFVACALFWIIFSNLTGFYKVILTFIKIISPILYGFLFAFLMNPLAKRLQVWACRVLGNHKFGKKKKTLKDKTVRKLSKAISIVPCVLILLLAIYALVAIVVPTLIDSLEDLLQAERLEAYYRTIDNWLNAHLRGTDLGNWMDRNLDSLLSLLTNALKNLDISAIVSGVTTSVYSVVRFVLDFFLGIVAAVYLLVFKESLVAQSKKMVVALFKPQRADRLLEIARRTNRIFGGYVIGKLIDSLLVGIITYIAMIILGMPYAPLIAVLVGVTNVIPFFGPFLGAIPSAILLLLDEPMNAVYFCIFILILQQVEGNILYNRIIGDRLGISDFWVLVSTLVFGGIFGFGGMLLGAPVFAVLYTLIADFINNRLRKKHLPTNTDDYYVLCCVAELPAESEPSCSYVTVDPVYDMEIASDEAEDGEESEDE